MSLLSEFERNLILYVAYYNKSQVNFATKDGAQESLEQVVEVNHFYCETSEIDVETCHHLLRNCSEVFQVYRLI